MKTGLYFYNQNNQKTLAYDIENDQVKALSADFYDPTLPTLIYAHGWQNGSMETGFTPSFNNADDVLGDINYAKILKEPNCTVNGTDYTQIPTRSKKKPSDDDISYGTSIYKFRNHTNKSRRSWNIAVFDWVEYADESEVKDAEAKIWATKNEYQNMRKRKEDGSYVSSSELGKMGMSIAQALATSIDKVMKSNFAGSELRFAGHSLGNQVVTYAAKILMDKRSLVPNRIELLDPFWSKWSKDYLDGDWVGERCRWYVQELYARNYVAVTNYRSSLVTSSGFVGDTNDEMNETAILVNLASWWTGDVSIKHTYVEDWYWSTFAHGQTVECKVRWWGRRESTGYYGPSGAAPTGRILEMMRQNYRWTQVEGRRERNSSPHWFQRKKGRNGT
jgi:hypothetical protein